MDFKKTGISLVASIIIIIQRVFLLIFYPYKSMRKISQEEDYTQIIVLFTAIGGYFYYANYLREYDYEPIILFILTIFHYLATVFFFYFISTVFRKNDHQSIRPFLFTVAYTFIPTIIWFFANSSLYAILPPPRTLSTFGKAFSILYISFSIAVLSWKIILEYLSLRLASGMPFYRVMYSLLLYVAAVGPYFFWMYVLKFFRVPFI